MSTQDEFRDEIERFLDRHHIGAATLGSQALKDPKFVSDLRKGRSPSLKTIDRMRDWMSVYDSAHGVELAVEPDPIPEPVPQPDRAAAPAGQAPRPKTAWFAGLAIVVLAAAASVYYWPAIGPWFEASLAWFEPEPEPEPQAPVPAAQPAVVEAPAMSADVVARLARAEASIVVLRERLQRAEAKLASLPADRSDDLSARVAALEQQPPPNDTETIFNSADLDPVRAELTRMDLETQAIGSRLSELEQAGVDDTGDTGGALLVAFSRLENAVASGAPYDQQLTYMASLVPGEAALDVLAAHAGTGVPGDSELRGRFPAMAQAVLRAAAIPDDADWIDETWARLKTLITVRPKGLAEGRDAAAVIARAEAAVAAGDPGAAARELNGLSGAAGQAALAWRADANDHARVAGALGELENLIFDRLSGQQAVPSP